MKMVRINIWFAKGRHKENKRVALRKMKLTKSVQRAQWKIC